MVDTVISPSFFMPADDEAGLLEWGQVVGVRVYVVCYTSEGFFSAGRGLAV